MGKESSEELEREAVLKGGRGAGTPTLGRGQRRSSIQCKKEGREREREREGGRE